jgi:hypothetical protein
MMKTKIAFLMGVAALAIAVATPVWAETTQSVTQKTSTVNPDGSVSYESHTVVTKDGAPGVVVATPVVAPVVTFYYYDPAVKRIVSGSDLTPEILALWDKNNNKVIDNHEFYSDALIVYEPIEYSKRTYQDIDADGIPELTKEEYTLRLQQLPMYASLNKDGKDGLTLHEFTGVGFQDADIDNDNQVTFDEFKKAFYHQQGLAPKPEKINE